MLTQSRHGITHPIFRPVMFIRATDHEFIYSVKSPNSNEGTCFNTINTAVTMCFHSPFKLSNLNILLKETFAVSYFIN